MKNARYWSPLNGIRYDNKSYIYSQKLESIFTNKNNLKSVFQLMGLNYDNVVNDIKNNKYPLHHKIGQNGIKTTGLRLIVEPIYAYSQFSFFSFSFFFSCSFSSFSFFSPFFLIFFHPLFLSSFPFSLYFS